MLLAGLLSGCEAVLSATGTDWLTRAALGVVADRAGGDQGMRSSRRLLAQQGADDGAQ